MGGTGLFGLIFWKRKYSGIFIISGIIEEFLWFCINFYY
jgi:hypothetical protein